MKTIKFTLTITAVLITAMVMGQSSSQDTVCVHATGVEYFVYSTPGSSYSWWLSGGGVISSMQDTLITVDWGGTTGTDTVYVVETNEFGCTGDTISLPVTREPIPVAIAGNDTTIGFCSGAYVQIGPPSVDPNFTYQWAPATGLSDPNVANPTANPSDTTTYVLTVISPYGCQDTDTVIINVAPQPLADAGPDHIIGACAGQSATLDASASTGINLAYSWSPAISLNDPSVPSPVATPGTTTTYVLTVTDQYGCTATDSVVVTVDSAPIADAGANDTICDGQTIQLNGNASTGTNLTYSWTSDPPGFVSSLPDPAVSPSDTTMYTLVVTDEYGCTDTSTVWVLVTPDVTVYAGINDTICEGHSFFALSATATNQTAISWSTTGDGTFINGNTLQPEYIPGPNDISSGSVELTITATGIYPCADESDSIIITIHPKPTTSPIFHY